MMHEALVWLYNKIYNLQFMYEILKSLTELICYLNPFVACRSAMVGYFKFSLINGIRNAIECL